MKKLIVLVLLILFWSSNTFAKWPWEDEKPPPPPKPKVYHYKIHVDGIDKDGDGLDDFKIWYVFRGEAGRITQVGIIDELERKVLEITGDRVVLTSEYYGDNRKKALISETWGRLTEIHFFIRRNKGGESE
jgi:hypothetical protein